MNILYLANHLNTGGISSYLLTLAGGLVKKGHRVYIASSGGALSEKFSRMGLRHINVPLDTKSELSPKIIIAFLKLRSLAAKFEIDLVHSHSRTTQVLGCLLSRHNRMPHVFTCHGFFKPRLARCIFPCWGDKVIAISSQVKQHLIGDFRLAQEKIALVHNGVDVDKRGSSEEGRRIKQALGIKDGRLIGIIGRLSEVKGHRYLIAAMPAVLARFPSANLVIVGQGRIQRQLSEQLRRLGIADKVFFLESIENTADILSVMDVFVMPSLYEGLGLSLMEAMAASVACVGSSVGGIKSLIKDGVSGLLVEPADSEGLSKAIVSLLGDDALRLALGREARKLILENFTQEKMVTETERVYLKCLEPRKNS